MANTDYFSTEVEAPKAPVRKLAQYIVIMMTLELVMAAGSVKEANPIDACIDKVEEQINDFLAQREKQS